MVSVITCVLPRASEWLAETWYSLESQTLPDGWAFEFLVQIDGEGELKSAIPENDPRIHISRNPRPFGPAIARNMALGRASGVLVKPLDADDMLPPGTLSREIDVLDRFPDTGWVISKTLDLRPDGTTVGNPLGIEPIEGPLSAGVILDTKLFFENHPEYPPPRGANRSEPSPWWTAVIGERTAQGLESAPEKAAAELERVFRSVGVPVRLSELKIARDSLPLMVEKSLKNFNADPKREFVKERDMLHELIQACW